MTWSVASDEAEKVSRGFDEELSPVESRVLFKVRVHYMFGDIYVRLVSYARPYLPRYLTPLRMYVQDTVFFFFFSRFLGYPFFRGALLGCFFLFFDVELRCF